MKSTKKTLYLLATLLILGGTSLLYSQGESLQGLFSTRMDTNPMGNINMILMTNSIEEAATYAEQENQNAQSAATEAASYATATESAYNSSDRDTWSSNQTLAESAGDDAKTAADNAKEYADQAQAFYDAIEADYNASYNDMKDAETGKDAAHALWQAEYYVTSQAHGEWFYGQTQAYINEVSSECLSAAASDSGHGSTTSSDCTSAKSSNTSASESYKNTFDACLESDEYNQNVEKHSSTCVSNYSSSLNSKWSNWDSKSIRDSYISTYQLEELEADYNTKLGLTSDLEDTYNTALANYASLFYATADLADEKEAAETVLNDALASADEAASFASQGLSSKNYADSFQVLSCTSLTLDPTEYEMAHSDTSADFELTATVSTEDGSTSWLPLKNLMAFVLTETTEEVNITGVMNAYPVETYETQSKWFGTLVFRSSGDGVFKETGAPANPLEIAKTDTTASTVTFHGGLAGDTIRVTVKDEQETCSKAFEITQAGVPAVTISESAGSTTLAEGSSTDTYTVALNTAPTTDVIVDLSADTQVTVSPSTLTFTSSNWSTAQRVTVSAVDDSTVETSQTGTITHTASSTDTDYNGIAINSVTATITDNDTATDTTTYAVTLTQSSGSTEVTEGSDTDSYTAVLSAAPTADVVITVTPNAQITVSPSTLTFNSSNWSTAQTVTVTAVADSTTETSQTGTLTHTAVSSDSHYNGLSISSITITVNDPATTTSVTSTTSTNASVALTDDTYDCDDPFIDTYGQWHQNIICRMYKGGVVNGRLSDEFVPNDNVTNAEFIKMVDGLLLEKTADDADGLTTTFSDVSEEDWFYAYVVIAEDADVIRTRDFGVNFNPNTPISRGVAAVYVARALGLTSYDFTSTYSDVPTTHFAAYAVDLLSKKTVDVPYDNTNDEVAVLSGYTDDTFRPDNNIARSEAAAMIYRAYLAYLAD